MPAVFIDGVPAKITMVDFRRHHAQSFPVLVQPEYDALITSAIDDVCAMFPGVGTLWAMYRNRQLWFDKTRLCYLFLTAWHIAEQYPDLSSGTISIDGLKRKKVDGVDLHLDTDMFQGEGGVAENPLAWLRSNIWGRKALFMIQSAPGRALLRITKFV